MRNVRGTRHSLPNTRTLTAIAHPSIKFRGKILTTELRIPAEDLLPGPCGYRVNVIDYDSTTNTLYEPMTYGEQDSRGKYVDPFAYKPNGRASTARKARHDRNLIENPNSTRSTSMRSPCGRWRNLNSRWDGAALGARMDIRFTSLRTHSPTQTRSIPD
jgi:hypothetical protein